MASAPDLLTALVPDHRLHDNFKALMATRGHAPARDMLQHVFSLFPNPDGNFVKDFQTTGFDARIWELFLFAFGHFSGFEVTRPFDRPDFLFAKDGQQVWVEAVTANPTQGTSPQQELCANAEQTDATRAAEQAVPIKLGSALFSKLRARYWELEHVRNKPLVLAIEDFHRRETMRATTDSLERYLYGISARTSHDDSGRLRVDLESVYEHRHGRKVIPSGFFYQPDADNVSAVLFSNCGTIPKFGRMAHEANRYPDIYMFRWGFCTDFDPNALVPQPFVYEVGDPGKPGEEWGEGIDVFHNPVAKIPLGLEFFGRVGQHWFDNGRDHNRLPSFHPYTSTTTVMVGTLTEERRAGVLGELEAVLEEVYLESLQRPGGAR